MLRDAVHEVSIKTPFRARVFIDRALSIARGYGHGPPVVALPDGDIMDSPARRRVFNFWRVEVNYYNEFDPKAAAWLRELIKAGLIPNGHVDERSITEVKAHELTGYTQCHFFAGIGGWSLALQLAGWSAERPVGTGSCPCQPFSAAGKQLGNADERHLLPSFLRLISECRALGQRWTDAIFGEQVEGAIAHKWLDSLSTDMEREGYSVGAAILGAHSVGAPQRRQRLYWVAIPASKGGRSWREMEGRGYSESGGSGSANRSMEHAESDRREQGRTESSERSIECGRPNGVALGDTDITRSQGRGLQSGSESDLFETWTRGVDFVACTDGRKRLVKSGIFPLAHGFPSRVGLLRGSGNAIVPQVAARFIQAAEASRDNGAGVAAALETMEVE